MSAPTDRFLDELALKTQVTEPDLPQPTDEFLAYKTVQAYAKTLDDLPPPDRDKRLAVLQAFGAHVDRTPDRMIEEVFDTETRKYRKRGFYSDNAKAFAAELGGPESVVLQRSNVIRSFFIANGRRLPPERPAWMS